MRPWQVVLTDHPFPSIEAMRRVIEEAGGLLIPGGLDRGDERPVLQQADALLTTYAPVDASLVAELQRCQVIARCGIGVDNIDLDACTARGIWVTNVPDYCTDEVADHAMALILALLRGITLLDRATRAGHWSLEAARPLSRIRGRALGLIGFGRIARQTAERARAFGLRILAHDPYVADSEIIGWGAVPIDLEGLLRSADVVSIHAPLTEETRGLIDRRRLELMKRGAVLVNTSRGGIVDEQALYEALQSGRLAGAALDVLAREGPALDTPLLGHPRVILTPHVAYYSEESVVELQRKAALQVVKVLSGQRPDYPVNRPAGEGRTHYPSAGGEA